MIFYLNSDIKKRLLKSICTGKLNIKDFPEFENERTKPLVLDLSVLTDEQNKILEAIINKPIIKTELARGIELDSDIKKRLLKSIYTGKLNIKDFPEFENGRNKPLDLDLSVLTDDESEALFDISLKLDKTIY